MFKLTLFFGLLAVGLGAARGGEATTGGRLDKRNDFFFAKTLKSVPRIGRRNDFFLKAAKSVPRIGRRSDMSNIDNGAMAAWPWFRDMDYLPRIVKKDMVFVPIHEDVDDVTSHLDLTKELDEPRLQALV